MDGYEHTSAWWRPNTEKLSRAPPKGTEFVAFRREGPERWGMSLLIKVLKYSSFKLLERYEKEWIALDVFIDMRKNVADRDSARRFPQEDADRYFQATVDALGELELFDAVQEAENLKNSMCFSLTVLPLDS